MQRVLSSAAQVDHSDEVIAHTEDLIKLMVDQETGIRGFLLTRDPIFLQPFQAGKQRTGAQFDTLERLLAGYPQQLARLDEFRRSYELWGSEAQQELTLPGAQAINDARMRERKLRMDDLRSQAATIVNTEEAVRESRSITANRLSHAALSGIVACSLLIAIFLALQIARLFRRLSREHKTSLNAILEKERESYAREQWLNTTLRSIGDAVIACDPEGNVVFMNQVAQDLTGWQESESIGLPLVRIFHIVNEATRDIVESPTDKVRRLGTVVGLANHTVLIRKDGSEIAIDDSGAPTRNAEGELTGIVMVFRDVTERRLAERALMQAEKLATAGRLAASVAHEVNNPLEGLTNLVFLARNLSTNPEVQDFLSRAEQEIARIAQITRQSLGFYRETLLPGPYNPAEIVSDVAEFYRTRARALGIEIAAGGDRNLALIGSPGELRQVISNLTANALDACAHGGCIRLSVRSTYPPHSTPGVRISISDNGSGIPPKNLSQIFEPFFTTKKDTGTGLGLWVSKQLIEKQGGTIRVRSNTGTRFRGSTFSIFLPLRSKNALSPSAVA